MSSPGWKRPRRITGRTLALSDAAVDAAAEHGDRLETRIPPLPVRRSLRRDLPNPIVVDHGEPAVS